MFIRRFSYIFIISGLFISLPSFPAKHHVKEPALISHAALQKNKDRVMLDFVKSNKNSYIALIWPQGISHLDDARSLIADFAPIAYEKSFHLSNYGPVLLYQVCQLGISVLKAENYIKYYYLLPDMIPPYSFYIFVFTTEKPLVEILDLKKRIRDYIGVSYWSIHTTDTPMETEKLAEVVFNSSVLNFMTDAFWGTPISNVWEMTAIA